jgi:transcriptional regulator with GAF, ATPase, and Fis domain
MPVVGRTNGLRLRLPASKRARPNRSMSAKSQPRQDRACRFSAVGQIDELFRLLSRSNAAFASSLQDGEILRESARLAVPRVADVCKIELANREPRVIEMAGALRDRPALAESPRPTDAGHLTLDLQVLASGRPILIVDYRSSHTAKKMATMPHSLMLVPLMGGARILGVVTFASVRSGRVFDLAKLAAAIALTSRGALALEMSRLYRETIQAASGRGADLTSLSHDLKNVLMSVNLKIEALLRSAPPSEQRRGWGQLERIRHGVKLMNQMVDDLRERHIAPRWTVASSVENPRNRENDTCE